MIGTGRFEPAYHCPQRCGHENGLLERRTALFALEGVLRDVYTETVRFRLELPADHSAKLCGGANSRSSLHNTDSTCCRGCMIAIGA
jgi:hypothetical protein